MAWLREYAEGKSVGVEYSFIKWQTITESQERRSELTMREARNRTNYVAFLLSTLAQGESIVYQLFLFPFSCPSESTPARMRIRLRTYGREKQPF